MGKFKSLMIGALLVLVVIIGVGAWSLLPWPLALAMVAALALWMLVTRSGRQAASVTNVGISTLPQRLASSSVVVIGIAGVVAVLVALLAMAEGYRETITSAGNEGTAIVLRGGSAAEVMSVLDRDSVVAV